MAEASGDIAGNGLKRRNATRRKEDSKIPRFPKGDKNGPGTSESVSEIDNGSLTFAHFNDADKRICPLSGRERPGSGLSTLSDSNNSEFICVRGQNFMADSENETSSASSSDGSQFSSPSSSYRTVTGSSERIGSSVSPESTMISGNSSSFERKFLLARKECNDHQQNGNGIPSEVQFKCTKCGHVNQIVMPSRKRPNSFPSGLNDLLQCLSRPSDTDSEAGGLRLNPFNADGLPNQTTDKVADKNGGQCLSELKTHSDDIRHIGDDCTQPKGLFSDIAHNIKYEDENKMADMRGDQCLSELKTHSDALRQIGDDCTQPKGLFSDITGHIKNEDENKMADKEGYQCLSELKTHSDDIRHIGDDCTQPKELLSDITYNIQYEDENTQSLLGALADSKSYADDTKPDVLVNDFSKDKSDSVTETYVQAGIDRRRIYSMYDNVQCCFYCGKCNNISNSSGGSSSKLGVGFFCRESNRYFCSPCEQEHKKQIPNCVIIVREK